MAIVKFSKFFSGLHSQKSKWRIMRQEVKIPEAEILAELNGPVVTTKPSKSFPWGRLYLEFAAMANAIGCDVKWAIGGLFRGWIVLTAVSTFSAALVLQNPSNFKLFLKVIGGAPVENVTPPFFDER